MLRSFSDWESKSVVRGVSRRVIVAVRTRARTPVYFLHIGKTGGTALGKAFRALNREQSEYYFLALPHSSDLSQVPHGARYFFSVRDPLERFVSGFNSRKRHGGPGGRSPWTEAEAQAFSRFHSAHDLAQSLDPNHERFRDALAAVQAIPHLYTMQYQYFSGEGDFLRTRPPVAIIEARKLFQSFNSMLSILNIGERVVIPPSPETNASKTSSEGEVRGFSRLAKRNVASIYALDYLHVTTCLRFINSQSD